MIPLQMQKGAEESARTSRRRHDGMIRLTMLNRSWEVCCVNKLAICQRILIRYISPPWLKSEFWANRIQTTVITLQDREIRGMCIL
jgi:hypothetical protein